MAELLWSLQDSQLVARFQRRCGLFPALDEGPGENGAGPADGEAQTPELGHLPAAKGKGAGEPANGLRRLAAPQAYVQKYVVKNYFYYYLFRFSAALGQEVFYITFLPFTHWNIDPYLSRRLTIIWVLVMYIGQVTKEILKWPRPFSPPVVKLEKRVMAEYGMPSTHAMAATAISFTLLISTMDRYQYPFVLGLMMAVVFSTLVGLSRLYTGMHTVLDVLGGILITAILIVLTYPAWTLIDRLDSASPLLPVCVLVVPFFLCYNYPVSDYYSPTRADTTTIMAAGAGVTIGFWINHFFQLVSEPMESLPVIQNIPPLTTDLLVLGLAKFTVGIVLILLVRQLVQKLSLQVLYSWFKVVTRNKEARRRLEIEVPYKFVTYTSVGICAITFVPMLHRFLGLL
ncbi:sphingosine-1-phosphate phosphatase 2 [Bos indicus]|uniref:Sphingosine-1-phosphate phosphatase 2 n=5 Tax=Bos TaxID=9903 RepID=G3MXX9_BOVIN|nr:sphingosine-1-phosphate phosphatase 2 [Bos taurus]XP_005887538.1 PREDICTED: sphingosine-1-phosphate phosphatase 2 [Bos mutus]XP_027370376.1 sphingosine-1-phosphate phosphatase 2 [Bos indicus x Bos taurus]XP_061242322.1 sphingosine-1-phosphate phosphatase 2 [Bos javanicus]ELR62417.1 Sphingosine-1-phosphate phosphatase 2 [Bos mutus]